MKLSPARQAQIRAAIYADAVSEDEAVCHQNIAGGLADMIAHAADEWRSGLAAFASPQPDLSGLFAGMADLLSEAFDGISSAHLQAIHAARRSVS